MATVTKTIEADRILVGDRYIFAYPDPLDEKGKIVPVDHLIANIRAAGGEYNVIGIERLDTTIKMWVMVTVPIEGNAITLIFNTSEVKEMRQRSLADRIEQLKSTLVSLESQVK
jgi:hypothetical protein